MITDTFDDRSPAIIEPLVNENAPAADACILTFSDQIFSAVLAQFACRQIGVLHAVDGAQPVYLFPHRGKTFAFFKTSVGAPACVGTVEQVRSIVRTEKFVVFGGAGCLDRDIAHGKVMVPTFAWRDEGTSYHYAPAADTISIKNAAAVAAFMRENGIPCVCGGVWTTDAFFRETKGNFEKRKAAGCIAVDMECAALQAMCDFRDLALYTFFTSGDLLDAPVWDQRKKEGQIEGTQHDAGHFDIALALAQYVTR
ncbi:MAG: nucleoside phosphorylase [Clostridia bacterium]|nr:nucleoside phosphorylase [Clostridia bacterium]